ncbi:MAG: RNA polymerase sporulation sigma factor SigK [Clostridia bacterium]|nr:RNA polymerase sporulation sigma factor SigK [Clostridia bacterium]
MIFQGILLLLSKLFFFTSSLSSRSSFPPPLSSEDEARYLHQYKASGDEQAKEILIKHNLRLVAHIVKKYSNVGENDDLISVGTIGLMKAIATFDPDKGTQLATFAARCIENEVLMMIRSNKKHKNVVSLSSPIGNDTEGNELTVIDLISDTEENTFRKVDNQLLRERIDEIMRSVLSKREYTVMVDRYGLLGNPVRTQKEVGKKLKISRSYVSRIEKRALMKIREHIDRTKFEL